MTDDDIIKLAQGFNVRKTWAEAAAETVSYRFDALGFARAILAESEAEQTIKIQRGFMGTLARAALEECAAEAPPACAAFISAYLAKHYP